MPVVLRDASELAALRADWSALHSDVPGLTSQLDYLLAQVGLLPQEGEYRVVTVQDEGRVTGVAPLVRTGQRPHRLVQVHASDHSGFLYRDAEELERLVEAVFGLRVPLDLGTVLAGGPTETALRRRGPRLLRLVPRVDAPWLALDASWTDPVTQLGSKRRADFRRSLRRAEEAGGISCEVFAPGGAVGACFDEYVDLEASGWKGRAGTALADDHAQREGLRGYLEAPAVRDAVRVTRVRIGPAVAAMHLSVVIADRLWGLKGAYDEAFKAAAPSLHAFAATIAAAAGEGLARYEFMGTDAPYQMWKATPVEVSGVRTYPLAPAGQAALGVDVARKAGRLLRGGRERLRT